MEKVEILMDTLCLSMGGYAPKKRRLIADFKNHCGEDMNQDLTVWHSRRGSDQSLVEAVREDLARSGCALTALAELLEDGGANVLYMAPGYLEEVMREMGLEVPEDMTAAMRDAGCRPVN